MVQRYVIGVDFGTLSGRAAVVNAENGDVLASAAVDYAHGVMEDTLTAGDGQKLPPDFALQVPSDYLTVLREAVPRAVSDSGIDVSEIIALGLDFTSSTVVATTADGTPLCELEEFRNRPHAYAKLWKHHGAHAQSQRMVEVAEQQGEEWLGRYGGIISSELLVPKALETLEQDPEVYAAADVYAEAMDWLVWRLTGTLVAAAGAAGYKRLYQDGADLSQDYLEALNPEFGTFFADKMSAPVRALGSRAGGLTAEAAEWTGLPEGISVAVGNIDAHVTAPAVQGVLPGQLVAIMGTSTAMVLSHPELHEVPGMFGVVNGGVVDGQWGYELGQTAVGDIFAWFVDNCVPEAYTQEAKKRDLSVHAVLTEKAARLRVGQSGIIALDWHNGNRSVLMDPNLSGMMVGQTLRTRPEEQYRALLEATAFGVRRIRDSFVESGIEVTEYIAAGGLIRNEFLMQIYADVLNMPISVAATEQAGALGSAIFAAVAAGAYDSAADAAAAMGSKKDAAYQPDHDRAEAYNALYAEYLELHDYFGRGANNVMHRLREIARKADAK
ncbi:MAG: ribulokinase [Arachnia sp.]